MIIREGRMTNEDKEMDRGREDIEMIIRQGRMKNEDRDMIGSGDREKTEDREMIL